MIEIGSDDEPLFPDADSDAAPTPARGVKRKQPITVVDVDDDTPSPSLSPAAHPSAAATAPARKRAREKAKPFNLLRAMPWRLSAVHRGHGLDNTGCVSILELLKHPPRWILWADYMIDPVWLASAFPYLQDPAVHTEVWVCSKTAPADVKADRDYPGHWRVSKKKGFTSYGCHHSKMAVAAYSEGLRLVVHTANLIYCDVNNKTQGVWWQDFPRKAPGVSKPSAFEDYFVRFMAECGWKEGAVDTLRSYDFSQATADLVGSVPGRHAGGDLARWGHMRLRHLVSSRGAVPGPEADAASYLALQFSSVGSVTDKWLDELLRSMSAGTGAVKVVWPTIDNVRNSVEGYNAGRSIPGTKKNIAKMAAALSNRLRSPPAVLPLYKWTGAREQAMPHIKTYTKVSPGPGDQRTVHYSVLTSANLSSAAWGKLEKSDSQLFMMHFELGVFVSSATIRRGLAASQGGGLFSLPFGPPAPSFAEDGLELCVAGSAPADKAHVPISLPFSDPPEPYTRGDAPWCCDQRWDPSYCKPDCFGMTGPTDASMYGIRQN